MEKEIGNISISSIRRRIPTLIGLCNDLIIDNSEYYSNKDNNYIIQFPIRVDGIIISLRLIGDAKVDINLRSYNTGKNDLLICVPNDLFQASLQPGNHQSLTCIISSDFMKSLFININTLMPFFISLKDNPVFHINDEDTSQLRFLFDTIENAILSEASFKVDIVRHLLGAYLYKLGSILNAMQPDAFLEKKKPVKREEALFNQFISLVTEHHCKERRVDFYAEQLFLSPKHFSTVVKKVSGKTAGEWIDEYVILEAKALLKYSSMTIQEVAYYLNFPNPSFFGKYFKHHTGMSPSEYKVN
jgi:AraC family transcriptional regulator, transcriptional activator of pobA